MNKANILMCEPTHYSVDYEINCWMNGNVDCVDTDLAHKQWTDFKRILEQHATVQVISGQQGLPDMVFTANAGLVVGNSVVVSQFKNKERKGETPHFRKWFKCNNFEVVPINNQIVFEGAGDCLLGNKIYWCGYGFRTSRGAAVHLQNVLTWWYNKQVVPIELVDDRFYHLDTCFCPLNDGSVMLYRPALGDNSFKHIETIFGKDNIIEVSEEDALNFACNAVNVDKQVITNYVSDELRMKLITRGFEVITTPMSEFIKSGGGCKCLTLQLSN